MRQHWTRSSEPLTLDLPGLAELLRPAFPEARVVRAEPMRGGLVNSNFTVVVEGRPSPLVVRLYQGPPGDAAKEAALLGRLRGQVPVPDIYHFAAENPVTGHPYLIMERVEGQHLDLLVAAGHSLHALGRAIGEALAKIHAITFETHGFLGPDLQLETTIDLDRNGMLAYVRRAVVNGPGGERLGRQLVDDLTAYIRDNGSLLSTWAVPCLVHGDFNPSNVLLRPRKTAAAGSASRAAGTFAWEVAAILDWEFALSATPAFDFAHLLRPPLAQHAQLAAGAAQGYRAAGGTIPRQWRRIARVTDLFAWIDVASRPAAESVAIDDARLAIGQTIARDANGIA